jgi:guanyl-specific ribonuclease Sa
MHHWVRLVAGLVLLGMAAYAIWQQRQAADAPAGRGGKDVAKQRADDRASDDRNRKADVKADSSSSAKPGKSIIPAQTIRDLDGDVAYRGDVDVTATLARIKAGELLEHRNDGSTFANRERRLPRKPAGYYKEYVHPTPGLDGPGPQRIVVGEQGETYYTPDHYESFRRLDE